MGISGDQAASVKATWKAVSADLQGHGVNIFCNFLGTHPDEQGKFSKFASVSHGSLKGNGELQKQALAVMKALGSFVNIVDNASGLKSATSAMAAQHKTMGVGKANFDKMFPIIIDYIVTNAGGDKAAWKACLDTIGDAITSQQ